jgi:hypothetical protein
VRLVYADRQRGKTVAAVEAVVRTGGFLLVGTYSERARILKEFRRKDEHGYDTYIRPDQVLTVNDLRTGHFRVARHENRMVIDNLELVIEQLVGMAVDVVTTSVHPETVLAHNEAIEQERAVAEAQPALPAPVVEVVGPQSVDERIAGKSLSDAIERKRFELEAGPEWLANDDRTQL